MCGFGCGVATTVVGAVLVAAVSIFGFGFLPGIMETIIEGEMTLINDTIQLERFRDVPFPLNFTVRAWNIDNKDDVLAGAVPVMSERGPYIYKLYQKRNVEAIEDDRITYRIVLHFEFDQQASYPHTEDDVVTIVNVPYNAILQVAEAEFPTLMPALGALLNNIFGENNSPIIDVRIRDLLFDGIGICESPGLIGAIPCMQIRELSAGAQNVAEQEDGSLLFSLLASRDGTPSGEYVVSRGLEDSSQLGMIESYESVPHLFYWVDQGDYRGSGTCNMINGTDSGIYPPFLSRDRSIFALNTDICRSVELRYQYDTEYEGIPVARFSANEWFLDNHERCFCLNVTSGVAAPDGCLLPGAMELYTCVGAYLVLSYPHFLYADPVYTNGVIGMNPVEEEHRIFLDLEMTSGTIIRGNKRAQFNVFMRPVRSIAATQSLRTSLVPIVWVEEGMSLPEELVEEITQKLLVPLRIVDILIPVLVAVSAAVFLAGVLCVVLGRRRAAGSPHPPATSTPYHSPKPTKTA